MRKRPPSIFWVIPNHQRGWRPALPRGSPMTVPSYPHDESPQRPLQPTPRAAGVPRDCQPLGAAAPRGGPPDDRERAPDGARAAVCAVAHARGARDVAGPRDRAALCTPSVFARYQRHEQALIALLAECYLQGVSTRKVRRVIETLCGEQVSASLVSAATKRLDAVLAAWRARRLDAQPIPYLIVDAHYERIRREGQVLSTAVLWVVGVRADGFREYLGCWLGAAESAASWGAVCRDLAARGLRGVRYVVSDEHRGLTTALQRHWPEAVHQRCQVHYLRNALAKVTTPARQQALVAGLRDVWAAPTRAEATRRGAALVAALGP